ncbi:hypothetical protein LCGC14_1350650 [marine sediment metagenome]|uniref:Uncharacterized protein n=1 Tax=marine sediment metagenome TaxID=412755 RepID=A0A0F9KX65_9ZZZZ
MVNQANPLDPLGIFGGVKNQVDQMAAQAKVPEALRPKTIAKVLDPLGLFTRDNPGGPSDRPGMNRGDRTSTDRR